MTVSAGGAFTGIFHASLYVSLRNAHFAIYLSAPCTGVSSIDQKIIKSGKLDFNEGMIIENVVARMLAAAGHKLYFYSNPSRENADERMEIDFLIEKSVITIRHIISPIEVKSGKNDTFSSLRKFCRKYSQLLDRPLILHSGDVMEKDGYQCLPLYMTPLLQ